MVSASKITRERVLEWAVTLLVVAVLSWCAKAFTRADTGVSTIWLANGFLLGMVLTAARERRPLLLLAGFFGNFVSGGPIDGWVSSPVIAAINVVEVYVASARQRDTDDARDLTSARTFRRFLGYAVLLGPLVATALHVLHVITLSGAVSWQASLGAFVSHALGIATFTPVTMALRRNDYSRYIVRERMPELIATLLLVVVVTVLVFAQTRFPLLFLVFPAMLVMAMRGGFSGTALAVVLVVVVAVSFTVAGHGPLNIEHSGGLYENFFVLQVFIASLLLTMFPIVVVLAESRRVQQAKADSTLMLNLLAEHSTDVIVLTDLTGYRVYVSPGVVDIFGYTPEEFRAMTWHDMINPEDHDLIRAEMLERVANGERSTVNYRARRKDGREIWIEALVCTFRDEDFARIVAALGRSGGGTPGGFDGQHGRVITLRDVSRRKRAEIALGEANARLESLVWEDPLTGLANRRRFDEAILEEWDRCARAGQPLTVIMLDVDHFKAFNDAYGHQQGDHRLVLVGQAITAALFRPRDLAVRYGGEEFAVVLPATGVDEAGLVAERIRQNVATLDSGTGAPGLGIVTASLGVAGAVPVSHGRPTDIVKAADDALYISKREGRNRTTLLQVNWPAAVHARRNLDLDEA